jgi:hypothetical protein
MTSKLLVAGLTATVALLLATNPVVVDAAGKITGKQIKNGSVTGKDIKNAGLTGTDVADGSLTSADLAAGTVPALPAQPAVAEGSIAAGGTLTGELDTVATLTYTAPANGYVKVTGSTTLSAENTANQFISAYLYEGPTRINASYFDAGDADGFFDTRQALEAATPVTAGAHTFTLRLDDAVSANFSRWVHAQVIVEFFPTGSADVGSPSRPGQQDTGGPVSRR